jgi:hypothetical protein
MGWMEIVERLMCYFRIEDDRLNDSICEIVIDERLDLKITHLDHEFLKFEGYFTGKITENDLPKLKNLLQWNFARITETEDTLSIEGESERLCLFQKWPLSGIFVNNLYAILESFVASLGFWADAFEASHSRPHIRCQKVRG